MTTPTSPDLATTNSRLLSLDAYRGFIMICLSWGGFGLAKYGELKMQVHHDSGWWRFFHVQFDHGPWTGWGFWDLIMPAFMFMVGMAMPFSQARLRLCWAVEVERPARSEAFLLLVDARSGESVLRRRLTFDLREATYRVFTTESPTPMAPGWTTP